MSSHTRSKQTAVQRRVGAAEREQPTKRPGRPKIVALSLAAGTLVLTGGGVFAATRPTWHPSTSAATSAHPRHSGTADAAATITSRHPSSSQHGAVGVAGGTAPSSAGSASKAAPSVHAGAARAHRAGAERAAHAHRAGSMGHVKPITYTVKPGDTLYGIAMWFKLHGYGDLYAANRSVIGANPALILPGERITISRAGVMSLRAATTERSSS